MSNRLDLSVTAMANDREVLKVVWEGKIPMKFIAEDDMESQESDLFFLLVPRVTYFPLIIDKASCCDAS